MFERDQATSQTTNRRHKETKSKKVCYSAPGQCRFGENCRYRHIENDDSVKSPAAEPVPITSSFENIHENLQDEAVKQKREKKPRSCRYFSSHGSCRFGENCKFAHIKADKENIDNNDENESSVEVASVRDQADPADKNAELETKKRAATPAVCRFYKQGYCGHGNQCRFLHQGQVKKRQDGLSVEKDAPPPLDGAGEEDEIPDRSLRRPRDWSGRKNRGRGRPYMSQPHERRLAPTTPHVTDLSNVDVFKMRASEIKLLKKRFPKVEVIEGKDDRPEKYKIQYSCTDPDWPYDVNRIDMLLTFPMDYPLEAMVVFLPKDQPMPDTLRRHVLRSVEGWIADQMKNQQLTGRVQLIFRPFIRWLDRKMEDLFTEGLKLYQRELMAKAAGFEFIPASHLQEEFAEQASNDEENEEEGEEEGEDEETDDSEEDEDEDEDGTGSSVRTQNLDPTKRGTEVKLKALQLLDGAASLLANKIMIIIQCGRCKHRQELTTAVGQVNNLQCSQCHFDQWVNMRASMAHQFCYVIGYLDLVGCSAFDMVLSECVFTVGCLGCSKDVKLEGIIPGQIKKTWCNSCYEKISISSEGAKFSQLQPSSELDLAGSKVIVARKTNKIVKDAAIQGGKPLPDEGTCKHYKKSFRWFRFPCCGKAYPCDVCHEEKEGSAHEMKLATRMICGFCAKEQPFSAEKPCTGCGSSLIKRNTVHWEGGKGCRDKVKMGRNDPQKYSDQNKTVSRKAQAKQQTKKTKLRHA